MLLRDKVIFVTGAGRGIGRGIAEAVAEAGAHLVLGDLNVDAVRETAGLVAARGRATGRRAQDLGRDPEQRGRATGRRAQDLGRDPEQRHRQALPLALDVTRDESVQAALAETVREYGRLDGWVNNAGVVKMDAALDVAPADWDAHFRVNVAALFGCCQLAARQMITQGSGGAIVNIASNAGKVGYRNMTAYNASKAAVISITRSLSMEWAEHGINVNAVCPGGVDTPMLLGVAEWITGRTGGDPHELVQQMKPHQMSRHVQPIEVGRVVAFLLSDHATIIRGQSINVDGGDTPY